MTGSVGTVEHSTRSSIHDTYEAMAADFEEDLGRVFHKKDWVDRARTRRASIEGLVDHNGNPVRRPSVDGTLPGGAVNAPGMGTSVEPPLISSMAGPSTTGMEMPSVQNSGSPLSTNPADNMGTLREDPARAVGQNVTTVDGEQYKTPSGSVPKFKGLASRFRTK